VDAIPAEVVAAEVVTVQPVEATVVEAEIVSAEVVEAVPVEVPAPPAAAVPTPVPAPEPAPTPAPVAEAAPAPAAVPSPPVATGGLEPPAPAPAPAPEPEPEPELAFLHPTAPEPAPAPETIPASVPAPPADIFSLDAAKDERPAPRELLARDGGRPGPGVGPEEVFSLDADEMKAVQSPPVATGGLGPAADDFVLDLSSPAEPAPAPTQSPPVATGGLDDPVPMPTPVVGSTVTKPARNGRPPLKITYVRPGEKSPLGS